MPKAHRDLNAQGIDLGTFLSAYATVILGNPLELKWSIGGQRNGLNLFGLLSPPQGLTGSHNKVSTAKAHVEILRQALKPLLPAVRVRRKPRPIRRLLERWKSCRVVYSKLPEPLCPAAR